MDSYLKNLIEAAVKKGVKKKKKKKQDMEEIVDYDGSVLGSKIPADAEVKTVTAKKTTDDTVAMARQHMDNDSDRGVRLRYWGESDMSATLGYEETMGKDKSYEEAKDYFMNHLQFDEIEAEERLESLGYVKKNEEKVRLIEEPKTFFEQAINDILSSPVKKEINPIVLRQLTTLKDTMKANNLTIEDITPYLNVTE